MYELRKYRENIEAMYREMGGAKPATPTSTSDSIDRESKILKEPRLKPRSAEVKVQKSGGDEGEVPGHQRVHALPISNFLPFSPQLVEVIPSMSEEKDGHGNAATLMSSPTLSIPSSPASEGELQIDDSSWKRKERSPAKLGYMTPAESKSIMGFGRRTQNSLQTVLDTVPTTSAPLSASPNAPLGGLAVSPRGGPGGAVARGKKRGLGEVVSNLSKKLALTGEDGDPDYDEGNHPLFSRCYDDQGKTAIAEIDPEPKRPVRKVRTRARVRERVHGHSLLMDTSHVQVKKPGDRETEPSPKKMPRGQSLRPSLGTPEPAHSPSPRPPAPPHPPSVPASLPLSHPPSLPLSMSTLQPSSNSLKVEIPRKDKTKPAMSNAGMHTLYIYRTMHVLNCSCCR